MKRLFHSFMEMNELSWYIVMRTMVLCCALAFGAFAVLLVAGDYGPRSHTLYRLAFAMAEEPAALLLVGVFCAMLIEAIRKE